MILILGPPVGDKLANMINKGLRQSACQQKFKELQDKYLRPENIPHAKVPDLNEEVRQDLSFRATEVAMKKVHMVCTCILLHWSYNTLTCCHICVYDPYIELAIILLQMIAAQCNALTGLMQAVSKQETASDSLAKHADAIMDATKLAIYSFSGLSQARRENVIAEYGNPLAKLCVAKQAVGAERLIDCDDICKKLKVKRLFKKSRYQGSFK
jgi:hypothetical protein